MADSVSGSNEPQVTFTIKNPSKHDADAFKLTVPLSATLADIQRRIATEYDGNPPPQSQTLIYAGKVLKEPTLSVKDIVQQTALSDGSHSHSMHLVVRAASIGGAPSTSATPRPAMQAGSSAGATSGGTQPAAAAATPSSQDRTAAEPTAGVTPGVETVPSYDSHRSDPSSTGGSSAGGSSSGQHAEDGTSDGGGMPVGPGAMPTFATPAGLSPMFVFGTHGSSNGLLYTSHGPAGHLGLSGPYAGFSQPGVGGSSSGGPSVPGAAAMAAGIQHVPYPYMMNLMNPLMNNPVMATAYQAAYAAALQSMQQQQTSNAAAGAAAASTAAGAGASTGGADPSSNAAAAAAGQAAEPPPAAVPHPHTPLLPLTAPLAPAALLYYPAAFQQAAMAAAAAAAAAASNNQHAGQQQQAHAGFGAAAGPFPLAAPFAVPLVGIPAHLAAGHAAAAAAAAGQAAGAAAAAGGGARAAGNVRVGLRQRFPQGFVIARPAGARQQQQGQQAAGAPAAAAAAPGAAGAAQPHGHRRYRTRTITFRISMRTLLQMLVFAMVLYQHCTWPRLCILLFGSIILYITALWPPFRQFVVSLARPPRPEQLAQMRLRREQAAAAAAGGQPPEQQPAAAAGEQPAAGGAAAAPQGHAAVAGGAAAAAPAVQQQAVGGGAGAGAGLGAGHPPGQPPLPAWLQQGLLREILAVLVSFITSLFPAWNYNAEDAAVFAAAQEMLAREEQQQRQGQGQQGQAAAGGNGVFP